MRWWFILRKCTILGFSRALQSLVVLLKANLECNQLKYRFIHPNPALSLKLFCYKVSEYIFFYLRMLRRKKNELLTKPQSCLVLY